MPTMTIRTFVEWRLTSATQFRFKELMHHYGEAVEDSDEAQAIVEDIKSLPGFPLQAPEDSDIELVVTDFQN